MAYDAAIDLEMEKAEVASTGPALRTGAAQSLAYLAAAPLLIAALLIVVEPTEGGASVHFMGLYGAALIVFFGGVRWGVAVMKAEGPSGASLLGAALPLVVALPLFLPMPAFTKFPAVMIVMAVLLIDDLRATRRGAGAPAWYLAVRLPLTVLIETAFLVALVGLVQ